MACQITSPFNKKIDYFERQVFNFILKHNLAYCNKR